jgi:integrase
VPKLNFTQREIEKLEMAAPGKQVVYFDKKLPGFGLRVGVAKKAFFVQGKVGGKDVKATIGDFGLFTVEEARDVARDLLQEMRKGGSPVARKRQERAAAEADKAKGVTFEEVWKKKQEMKKGRLEEDTTVRSTNQMFRLYLEDWLPRPLRSITGKEVVDRFRRITETGSRGDGAPAAADLTFRYFRACWNFAKALPEHEGIFGDNPVTALSSLKLWHNPRRRTRHVPSSKLKAWYDAVMRLSSPTMRDYLLLLLFTGMRKMEAASLAWDAVDFDGLSLTVIDTKNDNPLRIPITSYLLELMERRKDYRCNGYVFPGEGKAGHLVEPKRAIDEVVAATGIAFSNHDLRRTLLGVATEIGIDPYIRAALVNHTVAKRTGDITQDYPEITLERMREPSEYLCGALKKRCGII